MPSHQERREPLPKDYQFGDAGKGRLIAVPIGKSGIAIRYIEQFDIVPDPKPFRMDNWHLVDVFIE